MWIVTLSADGAKAGILTFDDAWLPPGRLSRVRE